MLTDNFVQFAVELYLSFALVARVFLPLATPRVSFPLSTVYSLVFLFVLSLAGGITICASRAPILRFLSWYQEQKENTMLHISGPTNFSSNGK